MGHRVLRQQGSLEADFRADPFAFGVGLIRGVVATASAAELWAKVGALQLFEVVHLAPGLVSNGAGDVDFELQQGHEQLLNR